ncbi:MAG: 2Fe-2S iron-sulfur cluster binding domain-containing protein [Micrococcales bacterium]|nr:2Fe-2S iron-sulfur cluster binding domain-containing protein [Micrococcales bacterium]
MTTHPVRLVTSDRVVLDLDVPEGTSVVEAAADAGFALPAQCRQGTCGSCHATAHGDHRLGPHSPAALPPQQEAAGQVLLCRTYPRGPMEVTTPYPRSRVLDGGPGRREGTVTDLVRVARDTVWVRVRLDPDPQTGTGYQLEPGQFVEVQVPGDDRRRAYSLAGTSSWDGDAELLIRLLPDGYFSGHLVGLLDGRGDRRVVLHGPMGAFGLRESGLRPRWFVAGGTGLAPVLSLLRRMAEWGDPHPARLFLGVTTPQDVPRLPVLADLVTELPTLSIERCVRHPDETWEGLTGTPVDLLTTALAAHQGTVPDVYVCGPPGLVDSVASAVAEAGLDPDHVIAERLLPT